MGSLLLVVHGSAGKEGASNGPEHGGPPAYGPAPPRAGSIPTLIAGVRHPVPHGLGSPNREELDGGRPMAVCDMPPRTGAGGGPVRGPGRDRGINEGERKTTVVSRRRAKQL